MRADIENEMSRAGSIIAGVSGKGLRFLRKRCKYELQTGIPVCVGSWSRKVNNLQPSLCFRQNGAEETFKLRRNGRCINKVIRCKYQRPISLAQLNATGRYVQFTLESAALSSQSKSHQRI